MAKTTTAASERPAVPDGALWREAMRGVAPLRRRTGAPPPIPPPAAAPPGPGRSEAALPVKPAAAPALDRFADIDRANAERLKRGLHQIEARLDLHGMTQADAHRRLAGFVVASRESGRRCVLVITGRGFGAEGPGVLKRSVPRWLEEPALRRHVLAIASAQPRHGGAGALYLLLRRQR